MKRASLTDHHTSKKSKTSSKRLVRFTNCRLVRGQHLVKEDLWTLDGFVIDPKSRWWSSNSNDEFLQRVEISCGGAILAPGYSDVQINGAFGIDFADISQVTMSNMAELSHRLLSYGVVSYLPTIISSSPQTYRNLIPKHNEIREALNKEQLIEDEEVDDSEYINRPRARILGLHLEGPYMNKAKKGAHDINCLSEPSEAQVSLMKTYGSLEGVKIVTLAPELEGSFETIAELDRQGIVASMGHTAASFEQGVSGVKHGASMITHMFNAMTSFHHRDPGLIGMLGAEHEYRPYYGLICDGLHAHPASVKLASCAHPEGVVLVTDAMCAMGLGDGRHTLGEMNVVVNGISATLEGEKTLAGAVVSLDECVKNYRRFTQCSIPEAINAASTRPAELLARRGKKKLLDETGQQDENCRMEDLVGTLLPGAPAEFILLNDDLDVLKVYLKAVQVWPATE